MSKEEKKVDYIIVGQGLAGSLLAYFLMQRGQRVYLFDNHHKGASSKVAAGLMNPITGRRFVKSWMVDELFPFALKTYRTIEKQFGIDFYKEREILRALFSIGEENQWDERSAVDSYAPYMNSSPDVQGIEQVVIAPISWGGLTKAAQVDVPKLLKIFKKHFEEKGLLKAGVFGYDDLKWNNEGVYHQNIFAKKVIFCEGHQARFNPWFSALPFVPSKGEMLEIALPDEELSTVVKHKSYIAPLSNKRYWVGSTYEWDDLTDTPSEKGKQQLVTSLDKILCTKYEVLNQLAAIRPTVKDRRPFIGMHPEHERLLIFNGLGTKGTSLGPYWADKFCDYILEGKVLDKEVDVNRYF